MSVNIVSKTIYQVTRGIETNNIIFNVTIDKLSSKHFVTMRSGNNSVAHASPNTEELKAMRDALTQVIDELEKESSI